MLDMYFIENRARLLDIAAFMDRIDRYAGAAEARGDFRYRAFVQAVKTMLATEGGRAKAIQMIFSDTSAEPIESAVGLKALGAWEGAADEGH
jgi:uncharacterized protein with HEPN domain